MSASLWRVDKPARRSEGQERVAREEPEAASMNGGETIPFDVLPPAIGRDSSGSDEPVTDAPKPRRRSRAARPADDEDEVAPAA